MLALDDAAFARPLHRSDDDYDVLADGTVVGRIFLSNASPVGTPWMWTLAAGQHTGRRRTAMLRLATPRWRRSRKAGSGSRHEMARVRASRTLARFLC